MIAPQFGFKANKKKSGLLTIELKERLCEAQNHRCCFCGNLFEYGQTLLNFRDVWPKVYRGVCIDVSNGKKRQPTFEHIFPKILGGSDEEENIAISCDECNGKRGESLALTIDEFPGSKTMSNKTRLANAGSFLKTVEDMLYTLPEHSHLRKKLVRRLFDEATWLHAALKKRL